MLKLKKVKNKIMELDDILKYIDNNSPKKIKKEETIDIEDESGNKIGRIYRVYDKHDIINEFEIKCFEDKLKFSHNFINPNADLNLDEEEDFI
ncbi:MAG: hypothetical protein GX889_08910 [Clostridiales bacterium]|nr:hypothetical protein [Clostridiales bacterium]